MQNPAKTANQLSGAPDDYLKELLQDRSAPSMSKIMALDEIKTRGSQRDLAGGNPNQTSMVQEAMAKMGGQGGGRPAPPMGGVAGLRPQPPMGALGPQRPQPPRQFASGGIVEDPMEERRRQLEEIAARMAQTSQQVNGIAPGFPAAQAAPGPVQGPPAPSRSPNWLDGMPPPDTFKPPQQGVGRPTIQMPTADQGLRLGWKPGTVPPGPPLPVSSGGRGGGFEMTQPRPRGGPPVPPVARPPGPEAAPRPQARPPVVPGGIAGSQPSGPAPSLGGSLDQIMAAQQKRASMPTGIDPMIEEAKKREQQAKDQFRTDAWLRLAEAGFGMAQSKNPNFLGAVGEGALPAVRGLQGDRRGLDERLDRMFGDRTQLVGAREAIVRGDVDRAAAFYAKANTDIYRQQELDIARVRAGKAGRTSIDALSELVHGKPLSSLNKEERLELLKIQRASKGDGDERHDVIKTYGESIAKLRESLSQYDQDSPEAKNIERIIRRINLTLDGLTKGGLAEQGVGIKSEGDLGTGRGPGQTAPDLRTEREILSGRAQ